MQQIGNDKVLFIAGFGPIVRDATARQLYRQILGISFQEEKDGYLHNAATGTKTFHRGRFRRPRSPVSERTPGPTRFLRHKPGLNSTWTA